MTLHIRAFAISVGLVTAVAFTICAFFVALAPEATRAFFSYLFHIDLTGLAWPISWESFLAGLVASTLGMGLLGAFVAWLYNLQLQGSDNHRR